MNIPNLSSVEPSIQRKKLNLNSKVIFIIVIILGVTGGFWISRIWPTQTAVSLSDLESNAGKSVDSSSLEIGVVYGDINDTFNDSATGTVEVGGVNGEGTHSLKREGGDSQTAALTSSTIDLDLFVGKKVEVAGETNKSNKASWLLDVGNIKIIE
jgi:hypothetical protein